jgi:hypothetical protein
VIEDLRFQKVFAVRPAEPAGVSDLQPDYEVIRASEPFAMDAGETLSQRSEAVHVPFVYPELIRIGAAFTANGDSLAAPNQFGAALAESEPAPFGIVGRSSVRSPVPSFHRENAPAVANLAAVPRNRRCERRGRRRFDQVFNGKFETETGHVAPKIIDRFQ